MVVVEAASETVEYEYAIPRADATIQSYRAIGYDLPTAIADIIDNSLSAGAVNVWLMFEWDGDNSWITVRDDGCGMDEVELVNAMRPGSCSPLDERSERDLGRFGLGLKTAAFSQAKRLIVRSRRTDDAAYTRCWDLDYVTASQEWRLLRQIPLETEQRLGAFTGQEHGTIVLLEQLDRLVDGDQEENQRHHDRFIRRIREVELHVAMVFHKFMERPGGITLWLNGNRITPWNPFLLRQGAQGVAEEPLHLRDHEMMVNAYVLPHRSKLSEEIAEEAGGIRGWNDMQGFYVYRNGRMVVMGDWLGLGFQKEEHCKLARIELNIPTALDLDWQIDVKKSRARPPAAIVDDLKRIARQTRIRAQEVYRHRGKAITHVGAKDTEPLWHLVRRHGRDYQLINRQHPVLASIRSLCQGNAALQTHVETMLRLIEDTLPSHKIPTSKDETPSVTLKDTGDLKAMEELGKGLMHLFTDSGVPPEDALRMLAETPPFNAHPEVVAILAEGVPSNE